MIKRRTKSRSNTQAATRLPSGNGRVIAAVGLGALLILAFGLWLSGRPSDQPPATTTPPMAAATAGPVQPIQRINDVSELPPGKAEHVEVAYFHRTQRCVSCQRAEQLTRKTLDAHFAAQLQRGEISLVTADVQKPENEALTRKYEASGSSLYLGVVKGGIEYILPVDDIWFLLDDEVKFAVMLRDRLNAVNGGG
jgi:hypothetical protein